jgi:RNA-directed DNA polymerase
MTEALTSENMSPGLLKVAQRAREQPQGRFHALAYLIDEDALKRSYNRVKSNAAVGIDGVSKQSYGQDLDNNLRDLHRRMKTMRYRHQPILRVHLPKGDNKTRPIGISTLEDKIVQGALKEVLEAIYEQDFRDCSYGFRPGRGAHAAIRALDQELNQGGVNWILEADIVSFFDSLDRDKLKEMLQGRVADGSMQRLIGKCLRVGILDGEQFLSPERGTTQGSVLSPLLGNVYLHYVLDAWFEDEVKPRLAGKAHLYRYADDLVITFQQREDAQRVMTALGERMKRYGLELHPDKTRLVPFGRPPRQQQGGKGPGSMDFLGFTVYWTRTRGGGWRPALKTRGARLSRAKQALHDYCRRHRHEPVKDQHRALVSRIKGHFNYFGVNGNLRSLRSLMRHARRSWYKWLRRRSQRTRLTWDRFAHLLRVFPLPVPRIIVPIWG